MKKKCECDLHLRTYRVLIVKSIEMIKKELTVSFQVYAFILYR